jgi:hypothetical protein
MVPTFATMRKAAIEGRAAENPNPSSSRATTTTVTRSVRWKGPNGISVPIDWAAIVVCDTTRQELAANTHKMSVWGSLLAL